MGISAKGSLWSRLVTRGYSSVCGHRRSNNHPQTPLVLNTFPPTTSPTMHVCLATSPPQSPQLVAQCHRRSQHIWSVPFGLEYARPCRSTLHRHSITCPDQPPKDSHYVWNWPRPLPRLSHTPLIKHAHRQSSSITCHPGSSRPQPSRSHLHR